MATTQQLIDYYANLLIKQYLGKPRAYATIQTVVQPKLMPQGNNIIVDNNGNPIYDNMGNWLVDGPFIDPILPLAVQQSFDLSTAEGVQLDAIAKYIGVSRNGFDFSGAVTLDDTQFRQLIQMKSALNILRADTNSIQQFIQQFFAGVVQVFDNLNMHMSYYYLAQIGTNVVAEFFIKLKLLPRPLGVGMGPLVYAFPINNFFGFRTYIHPAPSFVAPFNSYTTYLSGTPWLNYNNIIVI